jgi:hypothetical protein
MFAPAEWEQIVCADNTYATFQKYWACKEAYSKAIGVGLRGGLDFAEEEFTILDDGAVLAPSPEFKVGLSCVEDHWISVCRAPADRIVDAFGEFKASLSPSERPWDLVLASPEPPWRIVNLEELLPDRAPNRF